LERKPDDLYFLASGFSWKAVAVADAWISSSVLPAEAGSHKY